MEGIHVQLPYTVINMWRGIPVQLLYTVIYVQGYIHVWTSHLSETVTPWYFGLLVTSVLGFKARSLTSMISYLGIMDSSDPSLVHYLLTAKWSVWQPSLFDPHSCREIHKYRWGLNPRLSLPQHNALNYLASTACYLPECTQLMSMSPIW